MDLHKQDSSRKLVLRRMEPMEKGAEAMIFVFGISKSMEILMADGSPRALLHFPERFMHLDRDQVNCSHLVSYGRGMEVFLSLDQAERIQ